MAQSRILLFWYCTTYYLLEKNKPKYQPLEPPPVDQLTQPDQPEPESQTEADEPVESDDSPGQSFEILETPNVDQGKPDPLQLESPPAAAQLSLFELDGL